MLRATDLRFRFDRRGPWVVDGVDLDIDIGEVVGLRGPSGRGKTTIGRLLTGYLLPDGGTVEVDGRPLPARGRAPVQLVFQHPELAVDPRWRIGEVLAEAGRADTGLLRELSISPGLLGRFPHELSGGELQRVSVARAILSEARYIVADEVSAMLDAITQAQIWCVLRERVADGAFGLLAISHDDELLAAVANRTIDLDDRRASSSSGLGPDVTATRQAGSRSPDPATLPA